MASISNKNIAKAIYFLSKEKEEKDLPIFYKEIVNFLFKKRLLSSSEDILKKLEKIINQEENKLKVKIYSSQKINGDFKEKIIFLLRKRYPDKEIILEEYLDEKLLAGIKLEMEDEIIDLSAKNKIYKLQEHLTRKI
jgi:F-type H+-transporting ATPase subunit delta